MANKPSDPWQNELTINNFHADEVISALQKEIRRGNVENACRLAYEMMMTSPELESKLWQRLFVISVEDIGMGCKTAPLLIGRLFEMHQQFSAGEHDRNLFAIHAVRFLCECEKDRSSDELLNWIKHSDIQPLIPDYAIDMHTRRGKEMGRDFEHFYREGAKVNPEFRNRNRHYREVLLSVLGLDGEGEKKQ